MGVCVYVVGVGSFRYGGHKPEEYSARQLACLVGAALGVRSWQPRLPGQRGIRVLSLDGGGTRGVLTVGVRTRRRG
jgi:hypothetical protein